MTTTTTTTHTGPEIITEIKNKGFDEGPFQESAWEFSVRDNETDWKVQTYTAASNFADSKPYFLWVQYTNLVKSAGDIGSFSQPIKLKPGHGYRFSFAFSRNYLHTFWGTSGTGRVLLKPATGPWGVDRNIQYLGSGGVFESIYPNLESS
ncbi:hypothetical protein TWF730_002607 [Orbilia blumenaviensis]|uniref:Uncharacterized protein n=1 Tax=Orbilia blumenaviensis TaxID=1796055 RepID=A0AAV9UB90_9PEZI